MPRLPMMLRRGLLIQPGWVVDSDPERPSSLSASDDVRVVVKHLGDNARQALTLPAREPIPVLGVIADRRTPRTSNVIDLLTRAQVTA